MSLADDLAKAKEHRLAWRLDEAEQVYKNVLEKDATNGEAILGLGKTHLMRDDDAGAVPYLEQARVFYPDDAELLTVLGLSYLILGKTNNKWLDQAINIFHNVLWLEPDNIHALQGIGTAYLDKNEGERAKDAFLYALDKHPASVDLLILLGTYHKTHHEFDEAVAYYQKILQFDPDNSDALQGYGQILCQQRHYSEGLKFIDRSLANNPENLAFLFNKSYYLLCIGDYTEGWKLHEAGLKLPERRMRTSLPDVPVWQGQSDPDLRLVIMPEQGLGDLIQFVRYAALCKKRVGKVYVQCYRGLERLFKNCPYVDGAFVKINPDQCDMQISLMSLPYIFATTLDTIPTQIPYLFVPPHEQQKWAIHIYRPDANAKIGLVWSGSMFKGQLHGDLLAQARNMDLKQLLPLFNLTNVTFYNLQIGNAANQIDELGLQDRFVNCMNAVQDMQDTAAIIQNLDLVITVDTSVAHLAGALGKPVWVLSRYEACWRWLNNRPDSPWYPTARVFGQPKLNDWESVVADVGMALQAWVKSRTISKSSLSA